MRSLIAVAIITGMPLCAGVALADPAQYCEAYAKDAADLRIGAAIDASIIPASGGTAATAVDSEAMRLEWERVRDNALSDCLAQYDADVSPKPAKKKAAAPVKTAEMKPGSAAWNSYCAAKYVSFDPDKGTYTGKSGKVRPCQVTPN